MQRPIGIIGAMNVEIEALLSQMEIENEEKIASLTFYIGKLNQTNCVISRCGPGKVNAAVCAQTMILKYNPRLVINSGVAGGIASDMEIGDFVIANSCVQHDCDTTALGDPPGLVSGINIINIPCDLEAAEKIKKAAQDIYGNAYMGVIATGDIFLNSREKTKELNHLYEAMACEMEGGSIAHVCYMNQIPAAVLRSISDKGDEDSNMDFPAFAKMAAEKMQKLLLAVIDKL
ncbi:5'-methylthioadenosine/adenosylhomocysteine nucleosidase [Scatolibacter rhodanostii]|uniref:5'-methylthioadenosine/adenosylhomocysteine nucleosidase n=1 Tax=Scatolibacter rhodanostii TaxID=2014781 RepID=UPI000C07E9D5|nr:5'-methylthioadenosine/adenosylhomocysteine nucleosidase [Scatolibacter rhodanostii]